MCFIVRRAVYKLTIWQALDRLSQKASKYYNFIDKLQADKIPLNIILTKSIMEALLLFLLMLLNVTSVAPAIDLCDGVECFNGGQCVGDGVCNCTFGFGGANCNRRVCNVTECRDRSGSCFSLRCTTDATNCGCKVCNTTNNEVCIDDTCVDEGDVCGVIDGTNFICADTGEPCGQGFCGSNFIDIPNSCSNETCRPIIAECDTDDTTCSNFDGSCSDGVCLVPCIEESNCEGLPCIGGFCAVLKCGESSCFK
ncbi:hypothetical protein SNE40_022372 [Patella caerulea]|uniref:EGF-like domain-containing protein n=1 Tax=Patella caerulea TaxID=87958 RepID=A0AAN8G3V8_PATCE